MTQAGLLEAGERGRRDTRPYTLTEAGRAAFAAWIERGPGTETFRFPLLLTVLFGRHLPPGRLAEVLAMHRAAHPARAAHYDQVREAAEDASDPYALAVLDFGRHYERARARLVRLAARGADQPAGMTRRRADDREGRPAVRHAPTTRRRGQCRVAGPPRPRAPPTLG